MAHQPSLVNCEQVYLYSTQRILTPLLDARESRISLLKWQILMSHS